MAIYYLPTIDIKSVIKETMAISILVIAFSSVGISQARVSKEFEQNMSLETYVRSVSNKLNPNSGDQKVLALLVRFVNFGCIACLNEFFDFSDSLQENIKRIGERNIILMIVRDKSDEEVQNRVMNGWMKANGLKFPMTLVASGIFDNYFVDYTAAISINEDNSLESIEKFPIDSQKKNAIIGWLYESR